MPAPTRRVGLRWWLSRRRRPLAAALAALAVWAGLAAVRGRAAPSTVGVLVAARDLPPGTELSPGDLRTVGMPAALVPPSSERDAGAVLGRSTAVAVPAGLPITTTSLALGRLLPAGTVATPVRLADPGETQLLHPGDRVDVLAAGSGDGAADGAGDGAADAAGDAAAGVGVGVGVGRSADAAMPTAAPASTAAVVASDVPVLSVPTPSGGALDAGDEGGLVVLATSPAQASALAHAAADSRLSITVHAG